MPYTEATAMLAKLILMVAKTVGVPGSLLLAICVNETKLTHVVALNDGPSHTYGLCQVKYETAQLMGFKGTSEQLMSPSVNAEYAAKYLKYQMNRYKSNWCKATAAYNAGSYTPSLVSLGKPKNYKYVVRVASFLEEKDKVHLDCGPERVALQ